jgi:NitT/TauT family transport system ATP-binding protein
MLRSRFADPMPESPALQLDGITRSFSGGLIAVDRLSLTIPHGQFAAIVGPSGCGKSTLLRIIAGLDRPTAGAIHGRTDGAGYVFQDANLIPWRSALRNAALPLELRGVSKPVRIAAAREALARVGLADAADRVPRELSGGMRMRVSLARAVVDHPSLLLLDEPFAAVDELTRQKLDDDLRQLWSAGGTTVLFVTHSTAEAVYVADRVIVMSARPGRIVADLNVDLPRERSAALRGSPEFAAQTRRVYQVLEGRPS